LASSLGAKQPECETDHLPPLHARVRNMCTCIALRCLFKHRNDLSSTINVWYILLDWNRNFYQMLIITVFMFCENMTDLWQSPLLSLPLLYKYHADILNTFTGVFFLIWDFKISVMPMLLNTPLEKFWIFCCDWQCWAV
jgi:hypothetical protein